MTYSIRRDPGIHLREIVVVIPAHNERRLLAYWRVGGFRPLHVGEDLDLVKRLLAAGAPLAWDTDIPVLTSDRRDFRAPGGFGDFVLSLADESEGPVASMVGP
jgi:hypothetical protein